jgi:hypothetical protein
VRLYWEVLSKLLYPTSRLIRTIASGSFDNCDFILQQLEQQNEYSDVTTMQDSSKQAKQSVAQSLRVSSVRERLYAAEMSVTWLRRTDVSYRVLVQTVRPKFT